MHNIALLRRGWLKSLGVSQKPKKKILGGRDPSLGDVRIANKNEITLYCMIFSNRIGPHALSAKFAKYLKY